MLTDYIDCLGEVYKSKGFVPTVKTFGKTFGEYLLLELNTTKLNQIKEEKFGDISGNKASRMFAEAIEPGSLINEKTSDGDLDNIISSMKNYLRGRVRLVSFYAAHNIPIK